MDVIDILIEKQTAKKPGRPIFNAMLDRIEKGEASGILAWHPDRLARNALDGGRIIQLVDVRKLTAIRFPNIEFHPTAKGKFMLAIMFGQSKYYIDNLSENIRRGQRQKVKNGIWPMMAPLGYLNDRATRSIYPDPERGPLIRKAYELHATGTYTLDRLTETLNALGLTTRAGKPLGRAQCHRLLQKPIYTGMIDYGGELHEGKHEPLITKKLFDTVQEVMTAKAKPKTSTFKPFHYRGVFRCGECGCFITTETQKGHNYLRCTKRVKKDCSQPYVREEEVSKQIDKAILSVALPDEEADWLIAELEEANAEAVEAAASDEQKTTDEITGIDQKVDRLTAAYLDASLTLPEYREMKNKLIEAKQLLKEKLAAFGDNRSKRFEPAIRFVKALKEATFLASSDDIPKKRDFFKKVGSNPTILNQGIKFTPRDAWQTLTTYGRIAQHGSAAPQRARPPRVNPITCPRFSNMRRRRDSNSRDPCGPAGFQDRCIRPLCHSSGNASGFYLACTNPSKVAVTSALMLTKNPI